MAELTEPVVTRWISAPRQHVERVLADRGFHRRGTGQSWTARTRLPQAGDPVEVDVWMWRDDAAEINIRPATRRLLGPMSRGHERRYFDDAHRAAADLAAAAAA